MQLEWFETWFDSPYYHVLYKDRNLEEAQSFIDHLLELLHLRPPARVLDLACGHGRAIDQVTDGPGVGAIDDQVILCEQLLRDLHRQLAVIGAHIDVRIQRQHPVPFAAGHPGDPELHLLQVAKTTMDKLG